MKQTVLSIQELSIQDNIVLLALNKIVYSVAFSSSLIILIQSIDISQNGVAIMQLPHIIIQPSEMLCQIDDI